MTKKKERKPRDPLAWLSTKHPLAHTLPSFERAEIECENGCSWGQNVSALRKSWLGYKIAKRKDEQDELTYYANLIVKIQRVLGIRQSVFEDIEIDPEAIND